MNVFVLNTGRCGSLTFSKACQHITNYTAGHETRTGLIGEERLQYSEDHIEVDNRLSWFLGGLDKKYGNDAIYVHLVRSDTKALINSFVAQGRLGVTEALRQVILLGCKQKERVEDIIRMYSEMVNSNIRLFLKDKKRLMLFSLENAKEDFKVFWHLISAEGDLNKALEEWNIKYNVFPANILSQIRRN